jgi:hypothetical protein
MPGPPTMFNAPRAAPASVANDGYIQPNFDYALRVWWALFWRTQIAGGILDIGLLVLLRRLYDDPAAQGGMVALAANYGGYVINYAVALGVMYYVLHKTFRGFRIALCKNWGTPEAEILEPTMARSARIWWTYVWRTIVYLVIGYLFVILPMTYFIGIVSPGITGALLVALIALLVGGAGALYAIYSNILDEDFGNFRVTLVPRPTPVPGAEIVAARS